MSFCPATQLGAFARPAHAKRRINLQNIAFQPTKKAKQAAIGAPKDKVCGLTHFQCGKLYLVIQGQSPLGRDTENAARWPTGPAPTGKPHKRGFGLLGRLNRYRWTMIVGLAVGSCLWGRSMAQAPRPPPMDQLLKQTTCRAGNDVSETIPDADHRIMAADRITRDASCDYQE